MPHKQKIVAVQFKDGRKSKAIATGSNAAWICDCGRADPLLGRSDTIKGVTVGLHIDCPDCARKYQVVPDEKNQGDVLRVIEVD